MKELIRSTRTAKGPRVEAEVDPASYPKGGRLKDYEMKRGNVHRDEFHGEWNYTIKPAAK